jgi:hypothetical protein
MDKYNPTKNGIQMGLKNTVQVKYLSHKATDTTKLLPEERLFYSNTIVFNMSMLKIVPRIQSKESAEISIPLSILT